MDPETETRDNERRRGTVMFADITGFTALVEQSGDEEAYELVTSCLKLLDGIARSYGASVDKYLGDCIMAVFGVPKAVEDAPRAAINAAIEMRREMVRFNQENATERPLDVHIGINTGSVISGDVSGPILREFAVMGDAVNVSARLKDLAPTGEIWVGPETWRCTRHAFEFEEVGSLDLKGKQNAVSAYAVRSEASQEYKFRSGLRRSVYSPLVGRAPELRTLQQAADAVIAGTGRIVGLVGEGGLGKSRLMNELMETRGESMQWLEGRCLSVGRNLSYHPFQDLLRSWLDLVGDEEDAAAIARIEERTAAVLDADAAASSVPYLATLLGLRLPPATRRQLRDTQGDVLEKRMRAAVLTLIGALAAKQALVFVIDDLHWIDGSSLELLLALLELADARPILFLNVTRPHFAETGERVRGACEHDHADRYDEVVLRPLDAQSARTMIDHFFEGGRIPFDAREAIRERAAGNPFFAEEVVRSLVDSGAAEIRDGALFATARIHEVTIPGTIQEVVMARIDALDRALKPVLEAAAVCGGSFYGSIVAHMLEKDGLDDALMRLEALGLIDRNAWGEGQWSFHHPLVQEVAYQTILRSRRAELHRAAGDGIELLLTENVPGFHAMLAYHFTQGGDLERGEEYLFLAGDEAAKAAASSEALHFFESAVEHFVQRHGESGDPAKLSRLEKNLAVALFNRGRLLECTEHFDRALEALGDVAPKGWASLYARFVREMAIVLPRLRSYRDAKKATTDREREIIEIRFQRALAGATTDPAFVFHTLSTLRMVLARDPGTLPDAGPVVSGAVGVFSYGGLSLGMGARVLEIARSLVEAGHVDRLRLYYELMGFIHHFLRGDWSDEHRIEEALIEEGLRYGRMWEVPVALDMDCELALAQGDFARAEQRIGQLAEIAENYDQSYARTATLSLGAFLDIERGHHEAALAKLDEYRSLSGEPVYQVIAHGTVAQIRSLDGAADDARAALERSADASKEAGRLTPFHESFAVVPAYRTAILERRNGSGSPGGVRKARKQALASIAKVAPRRTEVLRLRGIEACDAGRTKPGLGFLLESWKTGSALGARPETMRCCEEIAARLREGGAPETLDDRDATSWDDEARQLRAELGLDPGSGA